MNGRTTAPKRHDKEDLGFLDDRLQLLDTVREMIDIELERRGLNADGTPPPRDTGRTPPDPPPRAHIVAAHREFLRRHPLIIR